MERRRVDVVEHSAKGLEQLLFLLGPGHHVLGRQETPAVERFWDSGEEMVPCGSWYLNTLIPSWKSL